MANPSFIHISTGRTRSLKKHDRPALSARGGSSRVLVHDALAIPPSGTYLNNGGSSQPSAVVLFLRYNSLLPYEVIFGLPSFENYCLQSSSALNAEENRDASPG